MAIIDVLKCDRPELMVWKWQPPGGGQREEELRLGTQLIVNHSQQAIFVKDGQMTDVFDAGHHVLSTQADTVSNVTQNIQQPQQPQQAQQQPEQPPPPPPPLPPPPSPPPEQPPQPQQNSFASKDEVIQLLQKLGELKAAGILTEEEFSEKKKELLNKL